MIAGIPSKPEVALNVAAVSTDVIPLLVLTVLQFYKKRVKLRQALYLIIGIFVLVGIFFMRWNVVIGGQLFSKSFYGFTSFKLGLIGVEGVFMGIFWMIIPFLILAFLLWLFPPWKKSKEFETEYVISE